MIRRSPVIAAAALAIVIAACGDSSPSPSASAAASATIAAATPSSAASAASSASAGPSGSAQASPSAEACLVLPETGSIPSDRFTAVAISASGTRDRVSFVFGNPSLENPAGPPVGRIEEATAPYTMAGSGAEVQVDGEHVVQVVFEHMSLSNDVGQPTYDGPDAYQPDLPAVRDVVLFDMSEGQVGWYIGYDGPGCLVLTTLANTVTVSFLRP